MSKNILKGSYATITITERVQDGKPYRAISKIKISVSGVDAAWVPFEVSNTFSWDGIRCQFYGFYNQGGSPNGKLEIAGQHMPAMVDLDGIVNKGLPEARTGSFFVPIADAIMLRNTLVFEEKLGFRLSDNYFEYKAPAKEPQVITHNMQLLQKGGDILEVAIEDIDFSILEYNNVASFLHQQRRERGEARRGNTVADIMAIDIKAFRAKKGVGKKTIAYLTETMQELGLTWPVTNNKKR